MHSNNSEYIYIYASAVIFNSKNNYYNFAKIRLKKKDSFNNFNKNNVY